MRNRSIPIVLVVAFLSISQARAAYAAPLLTVAFETQLETWLGQGDQAFTNIFTKTTGADGFDFHAAADGKGATFTLLEASYEGQNYVIGGYNPLSWNSTNTFSYALLDAQRTAFLYNLTTGVKQTERLTTDPYNGTYGAQQTYNYAAYGPTFGGGFDLRVHHDLTLGYAFQYSYGDGSPCGWGGLNILGASMYTAPCFTSTGHSNGFQIGALEVYSVVPAPVQTPEPTIMLLLATGLLGAGVRRWRQKRA